MGQDLYCSISKNAKIIVLTHNRVFSSEYLHYILNYTHIDHAIII